LIAQPARDKDGIPNPGPQGDYYCDANKVQGQWCPEIDIMEANRHVFAATPHTCDTPNRMGHYSNCDRSGHGQNTRDRPNVYGHGDQFTINTYKPFTVTTEFSSLDGVILTGMTTVISQEGREVVLGHSNSDSTYLGKLSTVLADGMTMRITYWGKRAKTMSWLDMPPCGRVRCEGDRAGVAVISNLAVQGMPFSILTKSAMTTMAPTYTEAPVPPDDDLWNQEAEPSYPGPMYPPPNTPAPSPQAPLPFPSLQSGVALVIVLVSAVVLLFAFCPNLFRRPGHGHETRGAYGAQGAGGMQDVHWAHPSPFQHQAPFGGYGNAARFAPGQTIGPGMGQPHPGQHPLQGQFATKAPGFPTAQQGFQTASYPQYMGTTRGARPFATMAA